MKDITHLLTYLTAPVSQGGCGWAYEHMHALGFAQGGSVLLETLIATRANAFGSAVSVCGPLLSLPTFSPLYGSRPEHDPRRRMAGHHAVLESALASSHDVGAARRCTGSGRVTISSNERRACRPLNPLCQ